MTTAPARLGDWMQTYTGRAFWPMDPRPEEVDAEDIAAALSMLCRYGGHVRRFYSVAEHCLLMSEAVAPQHALWALLHDATAYVQAEDRLMGVICDRFALSYFCPPEVKAADNRILLDERAALMRPPPLPWHQDGAQLEPLGVEVRGLQPEEASLAYFTRLCELVAARPGGH